MRQLAIVSLLALGIVAAAILFAQTAPTPTGLTLTATTANVAGSPDPVRIEILRWSTNDDREKLMSAWEMKAPAPGAGAGKGGGKQGKGGGGGGGGRGRGAGAGPAAPVTPESSLESALQDAATVGYVWSSESAGYAIRYAGKIATPNGSRIVLITERRLGATNQLWNPIVKGDPNTYEFSVIELRLNAKGEGEGKASLNGKVAPDEAAKIVTLEKYDSPPVVFRDVRTVAKQP